MLSWTRGEKIEIFNYLVLMTKKMLLEWLKLTDIDTNAFVQYNLRYTQEFRDCYLNDYFIFLKDL